MTFVFVGGCRSALSWYQRLQTSIHSYKWYSLPAPQGRQNVAQGDAKRALGYRHSPTTSPRTGATEMSLHKVRPPTSDSLNQMSQPPRTVATFPARGSPRETAAQVQRSPGSWYESPAVPHRKPSLVVRHRYCARRTSSPSCKRLSRG